MRDVTIDLVTPDGWRLSETQLPAEATVNDIVADIVDQLDLPLISNNAYTVEYSLTNSQGKKLPSDQTILEAGVKNGDTLFLVSSQELSKSQVNSAVPHNRIIERAQRLRVFLCHSSDDKLAVRSLKNRLLSDGFDPWFDEDRLLPGQDWNREITKAVRSSDVVLACLSRGSINRAGYVQKELRNALDISDEQPEGTLFLIPLKLEECDVPERLRRWQWVNLFESVGYERLKRALNSRAFELGLNSTIQSQSDLQTSSQVHLPILLDDTPPIFAQTIKVLIQIRHRNQRFMYEVTLDAKVNDVKRFLIEKLDIPVQLENGELLSYRIRSKALEIILQDDLTFRENGVPEMDTLFLSADYEAG